ncbi:MAG: ABC transporter permease [Pseudomonadota bacterium]
MDITLSSFIAAIAVMAAPLVLATLGETLTEKAGVVNLSLDGTILLSAMTGFVVASRSQSLALGFLAAALTGCAVAAILAFIGVWLGQSQVAVGFALTFLCRDLAYFLGHPYARQQGPQLATLPLPFLSDFPFFGKVLFSHSLVIYASFLAIPCCSYFLYRTRQGLLLRAAGENPEGCWARGINPTRVQMLATMAGGMLVGLGGAAFSLSVKPGWGQPQGCEGIGWIALALVIFGSWHPLRVVAGAYLFGMLQLLGIYLQDFFPAIPAQIFQVAPFPLMIFTLVLIHLSSNRQTLAMRLFSGSPPKWLGKAYRRV